MIFDVENSTIWDAWRYDNLQNTVNSLKTINLKKLKN